MYQFIFFFSRKKSVTYIIFITISLSFCKQFIHYNTINYFEQEILHIHKNKIFHPSVSKTGRILYEDPGKNWRMNTSM